MPFVDYKPWPEDQRCRDPEHDPPGCIVLQPGKHVYRCPSCGEEQTVVVKPRPSRREASTLGQEWQSDVGVDNQEFYCGIRTKPWQNCA